jgi:SAM-dependent methyltransferase
MSIKRNILKAKNEIIFPELPLWRGLQEYPGNIEVKPFTLKYMPEFPIYQSSNNVVLDAVVDAYSDNDYQYITPPPGNGDWSNSLGDECFKSVLRILGDKRPTSILEIGAGSLYIAKKIINAYEVDTYTIVDPSLRESHPLISVLREYFPVAMIKDEKYDLVLAFNCIEHSDNVLGFLEAAKQQLFDDGVLIMTFPDCKRQLDRGDLNVLLHEHLIYFTVETATSLFQNAGFYIESIDSKNDTFTVCLSLKKQSNKIYSSEIFLDEYADKFIDNFDKMDSKIKKLLSEEKLIGFHGATNGLNNFLFLSNLFSESNIKIYDSDGSKLNLFLPASESEIKHPSDYSYQKCDAIFVSAMSFWRDVESDAINKYGLDPKKLFPLF